MENTLKIHEKQNESDVNNNSNVTYPKVSINPSVAAKLSAAYLGLPAARQDSVDAAVRDENISRAQATLNEIINSRIEMYARSGNAEQLKVLENAMAVLVDHGLSEEDARKRLGLGAEEG